MRKLLTILAFLIVLNSAFAKDGSANQTDRIASNKKKIALTFDADLSPYMQMELKTGKVKSWYNKDLIQYLEQEKITATLFLTGMWIEQYATETKLLSENTLFEIGNHSYSHPSFTKKCYHLKNDTKTTLAEQIEKTDKLLSENTKSFKKYFRFPGLCADKEDLMVVEKSGYKTIGGDIYSGDGFQKNTSKIVNQTLGKIAPGSIVVLHMHGSKNAPKTLEALKVIIPKLRERGYTFVKVSDLINK